MPPTRSRPGIRVKNLGQMLRRNYEYSEATYLHMIDHVFLPRNLLTFANRNHKDLLGKIETNLLNLMCDVLNELAAHVPEVVQRLFMNMHKLHCQGKMDAAELSSQIEHLRPQQMMGVYVRNSNCTLLFMRSASVESASVEPPEITIATFQPNLSDEQIYGSDGNFNGDIQVDYPTRAVKLEMTELIRSEVFAEQICHLHEMKHGQSIEKDVRAAALFQDDAYADNYVTQWVIGAASNRNSRTTEFPMISKKMRDDPGSSFRRSGLWISMKVLLQLGLTIALDSPSQAKYFYKLIMLKFMSKMCTHFCEHAEMVITNNKFDTAVEMLAKIALRIDKLTNFPDANADEQIIGVATTVKDEAAEVISRVRTMLDKQHKKMQSQEIRKASLKPLKRLDFEQHIIHDLSKIKKALDERKVMNVPKAEKTEADDETDESNGFDPSVAPSLEEVKKTRSDNEKLRCLIDVENWVLSYLGASGMAPDPIYLRSLATEYSTKALQLYQHDPIGYGRMVLTMLKIIQTLDAAACDECDLFLDHHSGINPSIFHDLVLTSRYHMEVLFYLQKYFEKRNGDAGCPGLLEEDEISKRSFSVRFAETNEYMKKTIKMIEKKDENNKTKKRAEVKNARDKIAALRAVGSCTTRQCTSSCEKCRNKKKINDTKVAVYRSIVMQEKHDQNALVFELCIPDVYACLRDVLYLFAAKNYGRPLGDWTRCVVWSDHPELREYATDCPEIVVLGTNCKQLNKKNGFRGDDLHPDCSIDNFIDDDIADYNFLMCGRKDKRNTRTFSKMPTKWKYQSIKNSVTFKVAENSVHGRLQVYVKSTNHSQNVVLATQSECPADLNVTEYISFGSLRADGHRLQYHNLYRMISDESLSFETPSVLALVMQTLWQTGPETGTKNWYRESNEELDNVHFVRAMADLLDAYIERQQRNWRNPLKLMMAIIVVCRLFEINDDATVADHLVSVLLKFRQIALTWIQDIKQTISESGSNDTNRNELYANVTDVAICGVFTYFVNRHHRHFDKIFESTQYCSAVKSWLTFVDHICYYSALCKNNPQRDSQELHLRMAYTVGLCIEPKMSALIGNSSNDVRNFVRERYTESRNSDFDEVNQVPNKRHTIALFAVIENERYSVTIDYVFGDFHVNGAPMGRLPKSITKLPIFARTFREITFEVQPRNRVFGTVLSYKGFEYIFREHHADGAIIQERKINSDEGTKQLIPHTVLTGIVPKQLVENYSHWFNTDQDTIEFRPQLFSEPNFASSDGIHYELDMKTCRLTHVKTKRFLLDVCSSSFEQIVSRLSRLEHQDYINVLMDQPHIARVELVRIKLNFIVDCSNEKQNEYHIESNEYKGKRVSVKQNLKTLYGLRFGLVLEPIKDLYENQLLIMPHSKFNVEPIECGDVEHHVKVDVVAKDAELRTPSFFVYNINNECRTLTATSYAAWFYLAHLHAVTSYPLPDPFTDMTGVERALQILQSSFVWSSAPYDSESHKTLMQLAYLSPVREFAKEKSDARSKRIPSTHWPAGVRHHAAQDAFAIIVRQLITASMSLAELYMPKEKRPPLTIQSMIELNARSHARHVSYAPNCGISRKFMKCDNRITHIIAEEDDATANTKHVRELAAHYNGSRREFHVPSHAVGELIFDLFKTKETLVGNTNARIDEENGDEHSTAASAISFCSSSSLPDLWIQLYERIRTSGNASPAERAREDQRFHMIFTLLAFKGEDIRHLQILQAIAADPGKFARFAAPCHEAYSEVGCFEFDDVAIGKAVDSATTQWSTFFDGERSKHGENMTTTMERSLRYKYSKDIERIRLDIIKQVRQQWQQWHQCNCVNASSIQIHSPYINVNQACDKINALLKSWCKNRELRQFTRKLEEVFKSKLLPCSSMTFAAQPEWKLCDVPATEPFPKYAIDFDQKMCSEYDQHADDIALARRIYEEGADEEIDFEQFWVRFREISTPASQGYLVDAQLYPRLVPTKVLPRILPPRDDEMPLNPDQKCLIGALAVLTCQEQRELRKARNEQQSQMEVSRQLKQENPSHENWRPHEHPEWLLFEIEMNLSIRKIQVQIAERMIAPPNNAHSVMQLNMGEGKTSVIVPIVAAELADGNQLCTVTVLRHLFQTNLKSLRQCVGGMLGRRVYTIPCRRDMNIETLTHEIQRIYEECKRERGILFTLPEYRLSFELKIYDSARKGHYETAASLLKVHNWLNENSRHILDESDAILQPNYQLIYTVGEQLAPDGDELRWTCVQALLKRVPHHMHDLYKQYGDQKVEFCTDYTCDGIDYGSGSVRNRVEVFRPCRLLDADIYDHLKKALARDFLDGKLSIQFLEVTDTLQEQVFDVLTDKTMTEAALNACLSQFDPGPQQTLLILSGLLKFEVLRLALTKRWRVNYGCSSSSTRKMAVPFKAKDVAAEMTEFGHPDVAICLTHLSYYYSGLSDTELLETFRRLNLKENSNDIYNEWISFVPPHKLHKSVNSYSGVNLSDVKQRTVHLFPILRRNMYVIDYFLSDLVFPREAKMFAEKLMCSAWDLCSKHLTHPVTGFSGTNDTKSLLPLPIVQSDLPELEMTNENVRQILLRPENDQYRALRSNTSGMAILKDLVEQNIPVLLDAGALMLELNNEQVAREWLKLAPKDKYDAAIYFSEKDIMLTVDRKEFVAEFEYSVYREQLHRCVVYLDDVHTRGTDLKFPSGIRACVTLCGGITRDKTVQACMRMRGLRDGHHQISFWASHEADVAIRKLDGGSNPTNRSVVNYVTENSRRFEKEGMNHWLNGALNYAKKLAAHKYVATNESKATADLMVELGQRCADTENLKLTELYGAKKEANLTAVAMTAFTQLGTKYFQEDTIHDWILFDIQREVIQKLRQNAPDVVRFTQFLDTEYEKELEYELEQNREVCRPGSRLPAKPQFAPLLKKLCAHAVDRWKVFDLLKEAGGVVRLPYALQNTKLFSIIKNDLDAWDKNLWVTKDFRSVVLPNSDEQDDEYLRPVWWVIRMNADPRQHHDQETYILVSQYECNELMSTFHTHHAPDATLHMFSAKMSQSQSTLINNKALQIPYRQTATEIPMKVFVQLQKFAGSMYFESDENVTAYCNFMCTIPKPRIEEHQRAFEAGYITSNGFVQIRHRHHFRQMECGFEENPANLAIGIIVRRHGSLRKRSHVGQILYEAKRPRLNEHEPMQDD